MVRKVYRVFTVCTFNEQAVMHYSRHRLTASVANVTALTYASANDQRARSAGLPAGQFVENETVSVQFRYVALNTP